MKSPFKINLLLLIIFLFCFAMVLILGDNRVLFIDLNSFAKNSNPFIWENLTLLGDTLSACAIMLLFIRTKPDLIWSVILATLIAMLIVNLIKYTGNGDQKGRTDFAQVADDGRRILHETDRPTQLNHGVQFRRLTEGMRPR